jgi:hypothetical protein
MRSTMTALLNSRTFSIAWLAMMRLQQGFATGEMGFQVKLHGTNRKARMSALGQKRTLTTARAMATRTRIKGDFSSATRDQ